MTINDTTPTPQPSVPEPSGADLARITLQAARANARKTGSTPKARRPRRTTTRTNGREPQGFAAVLQNLVAERAWELPAAGGTLIESWSDIAATAAPRLADHVRAVAFDPETGRLDLRAESPAYATQARLMTRHLTAAANRHAGREAVRTIRVLDATTPARPDTDRHPAAAAPDPRGEQANPVKTRATASPGYRQALAAHRSAKPTRPRINPAIAEARQRQNQALNAHRRAAFAAEEQRLQQEADLQHPRVTAVDLSRARALQRLGAERAGLPAAAAATLQGQGTTRLQPSA